MMRYPLLFCLVSLLLLLAMSCNPTPRPGSLESLKNRIEVRFNKVPGTFALAFRMLDDPDLQLLINEKEDFHAASTMKTPVMIELYKQAAAGRFSLDDSILVKDEFYSIVDSSTYRMDVSVDSEGDLYQQIGQRLPIRQLMFEMITRSSNLATNLLIDLVDARKVTQTMRDMGLEDILVLRGVEDLKAFDQGLSNRTTAYDLMLMYEQMGRGEVVSEVACQEMIDVLLQQEFNDIIPAKLPDGVRVAHKTGSITGVRHDSGLVLLPDGRRYTLVLLSKEVEQPKEGVSMMSQVSRLIHDHVTETSTQHRETAW